MAEFKIIFLVIYFIMMVVFYIVISKRVDFLAKRNEQKIGEDIKVLSVMTGNVKWIIRFLFILLFFISVFLVLTML